MDSQPESRMARKREETRNKIIDTAVMLFNQQGINATTMEQISDTADIARGTLYNYFPSKDVVINAYIQRTFSERNDDRIQQFRALTDTRSRLTLLLTLLLEGVQRQKAIFETFMVFRMKQVISFQPPAEGEKSGLSQLIHEIVLLGRQSHELRSDLPEIILEDMVEFILIEAIKPFYLEPDTYNPQKSIEHCVDLFMKGAKNI